MLKQSQDYVWEIQRSGCIHYMMASSISKPEEGFFSIANAPHSLSLTRDEVWILLWCFCLVNAAHTIFKALWSTFENSRCLEWISVFRQAFHCFWRVVSLPSLRVWWRDKKKKCARRAGGNGAFDFLFTLGAIETPRCKRICDIESVLITKTGIKGDWTQLSSELFEGFIGKRSFGAGSCLD